MDIKESSQLAALAYTANAVGLKELVLKVFGPTCDYAGAELCAFTQKRVEQLRKILDRAAKFIGDSNGQIPARVIRDVVNDGTLRNDELSAAYFGGVLASSKSGIDHDDRGSHHLATVERLSYYQLKAHWLIYSAAAKLMKEANISSLPTMIVDRSIWIKAMQDEDRQETETYTLHALQPLNREHLMLNWSEPDGVTLKLSPFYPGAELFLWANGIRSTQVASLKLLDLTDQSLPSLPAGSYRKL